MRSGPALAVAAVLLSACGSAPQPKKEVKAPEPVTGLHALYQMFAASHAWAPDAQVYKLSSIHLTGVKPQPGKAGAWQVAFVSASLQQMRSYTFSVIEASTTLHEGINSEKAESWSGRGSQTPFLIAAAKKDSDQAYETALQNKKVADYAAKNPDMTIMYELDQNASYNNAAWHVIWGESAGTSSFSVLIDASTGNYVETLR